MSDNKFVNTVFAAMENLEGDGGSLTEYVACMGRVKSEIERRLEVANKRMIDEVSFEKDEDPKRRALTDQMVEEYSAKVLDCPKYADKDSLWALFGLRKAFNNCDGEPTKEVFDNLLRTEFGFNDQEMLDMYSMEFGKKLEPRFPTHRPADLAREMLAEIDRLDLSPTRYTFEFLEKNQFSGPVTVVFASQWELDKTIHLLNTGGEELVNIAERLASK